MTLRETTKLPFFERPDLSPFVVHLTKNSVRTNARTAFDNLVNILKTGILQGSGRNGFVKGKHKAVCFMDIPLTSLKHVLNKANTKKHFPRYEPYGIVLSKKYSYQRGARPVLYLSREEQKVLCIPADQFWRIVRFEGVGEKSIGWSHEREWRARGDFSLPVGPLAVLVKTCREAKQLRRLLEEAPKEFKSKPQSIIPLSVLCQGLPFMK